jgi:hypothetical protein
MPSCDEDGLIMSQPNSLKKVSSEMQPEPSLKLRIREVKKAFLQVYVFSGSETYRSQN